MKTKLTGVIAISSLLVVLASAAKDETAAADSWTATLVGSEETFTNIGRNDYFVLEPGYQLTYAGKEDGKKVDLIITVLNDTKTVAGVETRVIEERESADGKLIEVSRNYFALGTASHHIYYFGEDVDMIKNGKIVSHEGAWLAGVDGAKQGIAMPGQIQVGAKYYQERAPKVAMDRAENVSTNEIVKTSAGEFDHCLKVKETTPLEPANVEYKLYARGIGLVQDGDLKLVKHGFVKK
jgi:hypothetical protein